MRGVAPPRRATEEQLAPQIYDLSDDAEQVDQGNLTGADQLQNVPVGTAMALIGYLMKCSR
jgi:hypothetical protein